MKRLQQNNFDGTSADKPKFDNAAGIKRMKLSGPYDGKEAFCLDPRHSCLRSYSGVDDSTLWTPIAEATAVRFMLRLSDGATILCTGFATMGSASNSASTQRCFDERATCPRFPRALVSARTGSVLSPYISTEVHLKYTLRKSIIETLLSSNGYNAWRPAISNSILCVIGAFLYHAVLTSLERFP